MVSWMRWRSVGCIIARKDQLAEKGRQLDAMAGSIAPAACDGDGTVACINGSRFLSLDYPDSKNGNWKKTGCRSQRTGCRSQIANVCAVCSVCPHVVIVCVTDCQCFPRQDVACITDCQCLCGSACDMVVENWANVCVVVGLQCGVMCPQESRVSYARHGLKQLCTSPCRYANRRHHRRFLDVGDGTTPSWG